MCNVCIEKIFFIDCFENNVRFYYFRDSSARRYYILGVYLSINSCSKRDD